MKLIPSPLEIVSFIVLNSRIAFNPPDNEDIDIETLFADYLIDIDYTIRKASSDRIVIFSKIVINDGENKEKGHTIFTEGMTVFKINQSVTQEEMQNLVNYSAVGIGFNNLRGYISNITSYSPAGTYLLPAIDVSSLINSKREALAERRAAAKKTTDRKTTKSVTVKKSAKPRSKSKK